MKKTESAVCFFLMIILIGAMVFFSKEKEERGEILEAIQAISKSRAFPANDIPADAYGKAFDYYRTHFLQNSKNVVTGAWTSIGPTNIGGRTISIAISASDTSTIWLGSASGGLWKSTTGGIGSNAWTYVNTGFPILGVSSIAIDPLNSNNIYIGTGETYNYGTSQNGIAVRTTRGSHGMGILKSTDGGLTWSYSLNWNYQSQRAIWDIIINPKNPDVIYAGTTEGIYKSTNAGSSWNQVSSLLMAMDLEIDKKDTNIVYAGIGNFSTVGNGLYKTSNSGGTWTKLVNGLPPSCTGRVTVSAYGANNKILMAVFSNIYNTIGVYRSVDEGLNWTTVNSSTEINDYQGWYCKGLLIHATDSSKILAAGVNLYGSTDSGANFTQIGGGVSTSTNYVHPDFHDIISNPLDPNKVYMITDGGLFRSNNFCSSIYECTNGYVTSQFYIGSVSATDENVALGGLQDNCTFFYGGTSNWYYVNGGDGCFNAIHPTNNNIMYASEQGLQIYKSVNQGFNFNPTYLHSGYAAFVAPFVMCPSNPSVLYAGGEGIIKTTDAGANWNPVGPVILNSNSYVLSIGVSHTSIDTLYCGMEPYSSVPMKILRSVDGGTTYTDVSGTLPNRYPRDIEVNPYNSQEVYVVFSGFGTGHIYKSTNAGATWINISSTLPDVPFHCLAIDPENTNMIFAGSDFGVFSSGDGGQNWSAFSTGMPLISMVFDLVISKADTTLMAFTHGNGVYKGSIADVYAGVKKINKEELTFEVYPNPIQENFTIDLKKEIAIDRIEIISTTGIIVKQMERFHFPSHKISMNAGDIPSGTYVVKVFSGKKILSKKVIVN